jgi:hypothetical protein
MNAERWWGTAASALAGDGAALERLSNADRDDFLAFIAERRLAGLMRQRGAAIADEQIRDRLDDLARREVILSVLQEREARRLLAAVAEASIDAVLLKGTGLAYSVYAEPALRPRNDVDFMIRPRDEAAVRRVLCALGYAPEPDTPGQLVSAQFHYARTDGTGLRHVCDVHLKLSNSQPYADFLTIDELWRESVPVPRLHPAARATSWPHALLIACVHRIAHHYDSADLIWLWDIHLLARSLAEADWEHLLTVSHDRQVSAVVARGLERTRDALHDATCASRIEPFAVAAREENALPLFDATTTTLGVVSADLASLPDAKARLRLLREHLFPPASYLRERYPACPAPLLPLAYVYRIVRGFPKWLVRRDP